MWGNTCNASDEVRPNIYFLCSLRDTDPHAGRCRTMEKTSSLAVKAGARVTKPKPTDSYPFQGMSTKMSCWGCSREMGCLMTTTTFQKRLNQVGVPL